MAEDKDPQVMYCYVHPDRETLLRCNRCERPICQSCAVLTSTGYRCKECVRGQQKIFETARWWDYPLAFITAGVLSYLGSLVAGLFGFFTILIAPVAGMIIAEAVRFAVRRRRSKRLPVLAAVATVLGGVIVPLVSLIFTFSMIGFQAGGSLIGLLWPAVYAVLAASTVYYRLKGIRI
jgi:MFS family permease